jgi:hypothetical protein
MIDKRVSHFEERDDLLTRVAVSLGFESAHTGDATSEDLIVWRRTADHVYLAARCAKCGGDGDFLKNSVERNKCDDCFGNGWFGIDPEMPAQASQGSIEKVAMLTVRYNSGIPLWNGLDRPAPAPIQTEAPKTASRRKRKRPTDTSTVARTSTAKLTRSRRSTLPSSGQRT